MQQHLMVALAGALALSGLTAAPSASLARREISVPQGTSARGITADQPPAGSRAQATPTAITGRDNGLAYTDSDPATTSADDGAQLRVLGELINRRAAAIAPAASPENVIAVPASTIATVQPGVPIQSGLATWYGPGFIGNVTYCGEVYDDTAYTAASNTLPCGTVIVVTNRNTGASVRVRITDRGGFGGSVILDLSRAAFSAIAPSADGVVPVSVSQAGS